MKYAAMLMALMVAITTASAIPEYVNVFGIDIPVLKKTVREN